MCSHSRAGMAGAVSRWLGGIDGLPEIVQRLQRVQIENAPALEIIERYDTGCFIWTLLMSTTATIPAYGSEMTDGEHIELADVLRAIRGRAVISG